MYQDTHKALLILGIESSCDETAVALVDTHGTLHGQQLISQIDDHAPYGGVVPEIAARQHSIHIERLIKRLCDDTGITLHNIDAIAATAGPGLIGGVIVGVMTAKALCAVLGTPFYAINHLEGHVLSARLEHNVPFPYLMFLMSGGHCQIMLVKGVGDYELIGATIDDAIGEAFDKSAKMMGLGYPGGPAIERYALNGDPKRFDFPKPYLHRDLYNMSFSGLKTAVRTTLLRLNDGHPIGEQDKCDVAASLQDTLSFIICNRLQHAMTWCQQRAIIPTGGIVIAGGVAANSAIRTALEGLAEQYKLPFIAPSLALCTDNAAMIAWAAAERINAGFEPDLLDYEPRARWPLT